MHPTSTSAPSYPDRDHLPRLFNPFPKHPLYFVTCCVEGRRALLANSAAAQILTDAWRCSPKVHGWAVGKYVIMPDHVHFFARPQITGKKLSEFMRDWKRWTAREISRQLGIPAPVWQPEFFDHLLRTATSYSEKWDYVRQNPVRARLADDPDVWPFSGVVCSLTF